MFNRKSKKRNSKTPKSQTQLDLLKGKDDAPDTSEVQPQAAEPPAPKGETLLPDHVIELNEKVVSQLELHDKNIEHIGVQLTAEKVAKNQLFKGIVLNHKDIKEEVVYSYDPQAKTLLVYAKHRIEAFQSRQQQKENR